MQHFRNVSRIVHNRLLCGASILLFAGAMLNAQANSNTSAVAKQHPDWVQIPGQLIRPDCVHEIPKGANVTISEEGKVTGDVTLNGTLIAHYDACTEAPISTRHQAESTNATARQNPGVNGWVEASQENLSWLSSTDNIDNMSGEWYVPNHPAVNGALIYIFNGIEPASQNWILQPVLQYGYSPAGGGYYWGIASWLVSSGGYAFHSPLEAVNAGDKLWGGTWQTGVSGGTLHWESKAYDYNTGANSWITAWTSGLHWTWAYEGVLEVYGVNSCSQLPSSGYAYFFDNYVDHGYPYFDYVSPAFWGAVYQTGGLPCYFSTYANNTYDYAVLYY